MTGSTPPGTGPARELGRFLEIQNLGLNLPFAVVFLLTAANGLPNWVAVVLILVAFVAARNAGHSFNRWTDRAYDAANPRTRDRALVTGRYSPTFALLFTAANSAVLLLAAYLLNWLAFLLAPVALVVLLGYSYTKRFTAGTTVFLGVVQGVTPGAVYIAVQGALPLPALAAVGAMLLWATGFETIHSLGDVDSDRSLGLRSIPVSLGVRRSVELVPVFHGGALVLFALFGYLSHLGYVYLVAIVAMAALTARIDWAVAQRPLEPLRPFRLHFLIGLILLAAVAVALFVPGAR